MADQTLWGTYKLNDPIIKGRENLSPSDYEEVRLSHGDATVIAVFSETQNKYIHLSLVDAGENTTSGSALMRYLKRFENNGKNGCLTFTNESIVVGDSRPQVFITVPLVEERLYRVQWI